MGIKSLIKGMSKAAKKSKLKPLKPPKNNPLTAEQAVTKKKIASKTVPGSSTATVVTNKARPKTNMPSTTGSTVGNAPLVTRTKNSMAATLKARAVDSGVSVPKKTGTTSGTGGVKAGTIGNSSLVTKTPVQKKNAFVSARKSIGVKTSKPKVTSIPKNKSLVVPANKAVVPYEPPVINKLDVAKKAAEHKFSAPVLRKPKKKGPRGR